MTDRRATEPPIAVVLGCGDVGSAVACALHADRWSVVLVDAADPAWHRRGMAFTNAWYIGNAELDGAGACFCASLKSIPSVLAQRMIAATTWSWSSVVDALHPHVLVAAPRSRPQPEVLRGRVPITIGIGAEFTAGEDVDIVVAAPTDTTRTERPSTVVPGRDGTPPALARSTYVVASTRFGRFATERRIGDAVRAGEQVGAVGQQTIAAPATGVLLGLAARGARIQPGDELVEIDPGGSPYRCHGIAEGSRPVAAGVLAALAQHRAAIANGERALQRSPQRFALQSD